MPKSASDHLTRKLRAGIGRPLPRRANRTYLGFATEYDEQLFRAFATVHPQGVRITDAGWRFHAGEHLKFGLFSCAIDGARTCRLTYRRVRR